MFIIIVKIQKMFVFKLNSNNFSFIIPENYKEIIIRLYVKNRKKMKHIEIAKFIWEDFIKSLE